MKWILNRLLLLLLAAGCLLAMTAPAHAGRRMLQSRHYRIYSDLDSVLTEDLARRMDEMYDEYARRLADFSAGNAAPMLEAHLFERRRDYQRFIGDEIANTVGIFMPGRNCIAAVLEDVPRDELRRTLQHEAFHQFAYNRIARDLPAWLSEGLAELFEDGIWAGDRFRIGQVPVWRLLKLHRDMEQRRLVPFDQMLHWDHDRWNARMTSRAAAAAQYNQAWAMVHFLVFATGDDNQPLYRARMIEMLRRLSAGDDGWTAFSSAFSDNVAGFQSRFTAWARQLEPTPEAIYIDNQLVLAGLLRLLRDEGREYRTTADFRADVIAARMRLYREQDGDRFTTAADPSVYFQSIDGRQMSADRLYFHARPGAPLPDLVSIPSGDLQLRTRFHRALKGGIETELLIEHPPRFARTRR